MIQIFPSLLAGDFARLGETLRFLEERGASVLHLDVADGHFVPELSVGQPVVKSLRRATKLAFDLHLQVERPERYLKDFIGLGVERIAIHAEATRNLHHALGVIKAGGRKAGLALNPATPVESVAGVLGEIEFLLILAADLGFPAPKFLPLAFAKVQTAARLRTEKKLGFEIEVEGCIGRELAGPLAHAGADILVAGSDIFEKDAGSRWFQLMGEVAPSGRASRVS